MLDEQPLFVRLGRHSDEEHLPLSAVAVHRLVRRHWQAAGVPDRLAHPHALRAYWATHLLKAGGTRPRGLRAARARRPATDGPLCRAAARTRR